MSPMSPTLPKSVHHQTFRINADKSKTTAAPFPICLVTGGAGYIGSHTVLELLTAGFAVVVIDNLCNSHLESLCRVHHIVTKEFERCGETSRPVPPILFHKVDIRDAHSINAVFTFWQNAKATLDPELLPIDVAAMVAKKAYPMLEYKIDPAKRSQVTPLAVHAETHGKIVSVIHFAALKAVGESISKPLDYYDTNIAGLLVILRAIERNAINTFVFSSSAVVYGAGNEAGITEDTVQVAGKGSGGGLLTNPYGRSKWISEEIINDFCVAHPNFHATSLRYFNPTGAHPSGLIGEDPKGTPNNIVPVIMQAYSRRRSRVHVFGSNYDTADGTGVRDYIHVSDLAKGHLAALRKAVADTMENPVDRSPSSPTSPTSPTSPSHVPGANYHAYNLGTGRGYSVLEIIKAFSTAAGTSVPFTVDAARPGDLGTVTASPDKASTELDWKAEFDLQDMCEDVFNWAAANPGGYEVLRRMSTISGASGGSANEMRRASVASSLFESEEDYNNFVMNTAYQLSKKGADGSSRPASVRLSMNSASMGSALARFRTLSISSASSEEDKSAASSPTVPRFTMTWENSSRRPLSQIGPMTPTGLQPTIEEEEPTNANPVPV
ncbi:gal10 bifunctional protein [Diaporthe amygdali]|uniref:gal10 bifunctional protein n=1 Tax=Phomopsis amygdali TaxID=1214568 RepID=UPI0022FE9C6A|nr:gal10 bifunctional protein [Diaporthe amygdali]KAJ0122359.1 gal10 bifunctional protein [Diaporthe amygdali]